MVGNYSIQFHDKNGVKRMREKVFGDFEALFAYAMKFRGNESTDAINVHLPARATDAERYRMRANGFIASF